MKARSLSIFIFILLYCLQFSALQFHHHEHSADTVSSFALDAQASCDLCHYLSQVRHNPNISPGVAACNPAPLEITECVPAELKHRFTADRLDHSHASRAPPAFPSLA